VLDQVEEGNRELIGTRSMSPFAAASARSRLLLALAALSVLTAGCRQEAQRAAPESRLEPADLAALESRVFGPGPVRVVNFWATWCQPCVEELPELVALAEAGADYHVIGISLDLSVPGGQQAIEPRVRSFLNQRGVFYENYLFTGSLPALLERFDLPGTIPYTMILSPAGEILWRHEGRTTRERIAAGLAAVPAGATPAAGAL
jgi:thiol-disulfide isomerase/thioredoxin